jgi:hypothetical protein
MVRFLYSQLVIIASFWLLNFSAQAQVTGRISGEMLSKERQSDGRFVMNAGKFYYDTQIKQLIYQMRFPAKETVVSHDTLLYRFQNKKLTMKMSSLTIPVSSIFHLALTNQLKNFGLKAPLYTIEKVEKEGDRVFVTYKPGKLIANFGLVKLAQRNNRLEGSVFLDKKGAVIAKQFFKSYITVGSVDFPQEVSVESIRNGKSYYQLTTYKNIVVNDFQDEVNYRYALPK